MLQRETCFNIGYIQCLYGQYLFIDALRSSDYIALTDRMINEPWIEKYMEQSQTVVLLVGVSWLNICHLASHHVRYFTALCQLYML